MKKLVGLMFLGLMVTLFSCSNEESYVIISTDMGDMKARIYNSTPKHRDNFLKLVKEGYYDGTMFHRVIKGFMVQGGDPDSKTANAESLIGMGGPGYTLPAEIKEVHIRGAISAARLGDATNPDRLSSGSQFFIVQGSPVTNEMLDAFETTKGIKYTPEQRAKYVELGGTPQLDNEYSVFGEVVEGLETIDKIGAVERGVADRPLTDIKMTIKLVE